MKLFRREELLCFRLWITKAITVNRLIFAKESSRPNCSDSIWQNWVLWIRLIVDLNLDSKLLISRVVWEAKSIFTCFQSSQCDYWLLTLIWTQSELRFPTRLCTSKWLLDVTGFISNDMFLCFCSNKGWDVFVWIFC